ncbi:hypothetical protein QBC32DRAFT_360656 [Pseudoneurospora amorphoporcata]|uniref:Uncharacterized protein n=1 Tax=Pseudoneurospora amorphoporcata TaxID=241081 RepID=A0AAN6SHS2_9PEZI|nr:hypothetical protein QBC32DRAFT_360656 [Pseudoneurospora amorphoporcata]
MSRGGGLVFTGMPRRREVLGTGIIRWAKVVNPDGTVTWQEAQPTASLDSKKENEKTDKKQTLERPSWIDVKKESSNVRISDKRRATDAEDLKAEEQKVEARPARAFSFRTEEKETKRTENATNNVEQVRFAAAPIHVRNDEKKGLVAGLATKFGSTSSKAEAFSLPKKEKVEMQQPAARPVLERRNAEELYSDKLKLLTRDEPPKAHSPPQTEEEKKNPLANDFPSHYWSTQQEDPKQEESDGELAQRLANTEKIFRQQEQKIQAALDRIRDLERQLATTGFSSSSSSSSSTAEQDDVQSKTSMLSSEDDSIAAGGREAGPYFRHAISSSISSMSLSAPTKGPPLPFSDQDDDEEPHSGYRVLTVNSHKPQLCAVEDDDEVNHHHHHHHELEGSTGVISDDNNTSRRTPSPRAVDIPQYEEHPKSSPTPAPAPAPAAQQLHLHPIVNAPHSHTYHTLKPPKPPTPHRRHQTTSPRGSMSHSHSQPPRQTAASMSSSSARRHIQLQKTTTTRRRKSPPIDAHPRGTVFVEAQAEGGEDEEDVSEQQYMYQEGFDSWGAV